MSNALAIATVTQTLRNVLNDAISVSNVAGASVTFVRPDDQAHLPSPGVNAFLYQVAPNAALRNSDLPTRTPDGALLHRPQAALDLFYLMTFYGNDSHLEQQRLLGAVTLALHAQPWLRTADILAAQGAPYLAGADLANQTERVRFRPINFSLEELSKLWSFLLKTDYVLSAAYVASVVLIDTSDATPPPALPVLQPKLVVLPVRPPVITAITPVAGPGGAIVPGAQINVTGVGLLGPAGTTTVVEVGGAALAPTAASATQLTVTLPLGLQAGLQTATVVQEPLLGLPPSPHAGGVQSTPATFTLSPLIRRGGSPVSYQIAVQTGVGSPPGDAITVELDPTVQPGQRVVLVLRPPGVGALPTLFDGGIVSAATNALIFTVAPPPSGVYFVEVIVDNAESPLDTDAAGNPIGPRITL
jgi:hypothetical protein